MQLFFVINALRDIAQNADKQRVIIGIFAGRDCGFCWKFTAPFVADFEDVPSVVYDFALATVGQKLQALGVFCLVLFGNEEFMNRLPQSFGFGVAKNALGGGIVLFDVA